MALFFLSWLAVAVPLMDFSDIRPGMTGTCRTVFEGDQPEDFPFTVKGVMSNYLGPKRDLLVIRLGGDKAEFSGVVAGMSGSPCSIDGRLVGALGYSFSSFAKEPIAGVTPIKDMLSVWDLPSEGLEWRDPPDHVRLASAGQDQTLRPMVTPLSMAGVPEAVRQHYASSFERVGLMPVAGGAAQGDVARTPTRFVPGGSISAALITGDLDVAANGTVTWVDGDRVLAFGHPFLSAGSVSLPMANAHVVNTMASLQRSFKMAVTGSVVGELTQDRLPAIAGVMGRRPRMVPVSGSIKSPSGKHDFSFQVARDLTLTPRLIGMGLASVMTGRVEATARGLLRASTTIRVAELTDPIVYHHVVSAERDPSLMLYLANEVANRVQALWRNPFVAAPHVEVAMKVEHEPRPRSERLVRAATSCTSCRVGEALDVTVALRAHQGGLRSHTFRWEVPFRLRGHKLEIYVGDAFYTADVLAKAAPPTAPTSLSEIAAQLQLLPTEGTLHMLVVAKELGLALPSGIGGTVPGSVAATFADQKRVALRTTSVVHRAKTVVPGVVGGGQLLKVQVSSQTEKTK